MNWSIRCYVFDVTNRLFERTWDLWTNIHTTRHLNCTTQFIDDPFLISGGGENVLTKNFQQNQVSTLLSKKSKYISRFFKYWKRNLFCQKKNFCLFYDAFGVVSFVRYTILFLRRGKIRVNDRVQFRRAVLFVSGYFIIFCERRVAKASSKCRNSS